VRGSPSQLFQTTLSTGMILHGVNARNNYVGLLVPPKWCWQLVNHWDLIIDH